MPAVVRCIGRLALAVGGGVVALRQNAAVRPVWSNAYALQQAESLGQEAAAQQAQAGAFGGFGRRSRGEF